jgi:hypothetical protein
MVGIHSTRSFNTATGQANLSHNDLEFDGRAAPNLGIYNRVVHREQEAKRGYKFAAVLINGCLGVQIVVAAALTAMGAANSNHVGITAFGAINTVIAGLLTYLKGSGLPMRLRYYENEWKKVREYIEQRERDFCRPDCPLNVHEIVRIIEAMYEDVKAEIQTNTPDSYVSVGDIRNRGRATNPQVPKLHEIGLSPQHAQTSAQNKFQELEMKYGHKITGFMESLASKEEERLKQLEKGLEANVAGKAQEAGRIFDKDFEIGKSRVANAGRDLEKEAEANAARVVDTARDVEKEAERARAYAAGESERVRGGLVSEAERVRANAERLAREAERERANAARLAREAEERERAHAARLARELEDEIQPHEEDPRRR